MDTLLSGLALVLERRQQLDRLEQEITNKTNLILQTANELHNQTDYNANKIIRSLNGVDVILFHDSGDLYKYFTRRMQEAQRSVDDITWGPGEGERTPASRATFEEYFATIEKVCAKKTIAYREIFSVPPFTQLERMDTMLRKNLFGYHMRYYELSSEVNELPLLQFMVIDSEEVVIAFYRAPVLPSEREVRLAIKHPTIVNLFQDYYDTLWQGAQPVEQNSAGRATLRALKTRFQSSM